MKSALLALAFSLLLLTGIGFAQPASASSSPLTQSLLEKSNAVHNFRKSKDVDSLKALLTDDFEYVSGDGRLHGRDELFSDMQDEPLREFKLYAPQVVEIDSGTALLTYNAILDLREGDEPGMAPRYQKVSDLWVKQGDTWRLKFEQATPVRPID
jgi:hypothetical protein